MYTRTFRMPVLALAAALALGALGTSAAEAKPSKPGGVPNLAGVATWHTGTTYDVAATWGSVSGATGYRATILKGGTTLASAKVSGLSWDPTVTSGPGQVTVQVQAVVSRRKGAPSQVTVNLPDKIAPTGSFTTSKNEATKVGTITQTALNDDSGVSGVTRSVQWGDGTAAVDWTSGTSITHTYTAVGRYVPVVKLTDGSGNSSSLPLDAIVLGDVTAPTGSFDVAPGTAWAGYSPVVLDESGLSDDVSQPDYIRVHVAWGDGSSTDVKGTAPLQHVYAAAGGYAATVTLTDEAGNQAHIDLGTVQVLADTTGPVVTEKIPAHRHSVRAWKRLHGTATDAGTGVDAVSVKAVEKRKGAWYGYDAGTGTWHKARTKATAFARSKAFTLATDAQGRWTAKLAGLRKGTLVTKARATDHVGNRSATVTTKGILTHR